MVERNPQELELSVRESDRLAVVPNHATCGIEPQALQFPDPAIPEVETLLVALHLGLDDLEVDSRGLLGRRLQVLDVAMNTAQDPSFELEEIGVDAHPMAGVFPPRGADVLTLERSRRAAPNRGHRPIFTPLS